MIKIHVLNGPEKGQSFEVEGDTIHVGRSSANDLKLTDNSISRKHLCIRVDGDKYYVKDLKSTNGTVVQGLKITPETEVEVAQGVPIAIGNIFFSIDKPYEGDVDTIEGDMDLSKSLEEGAPVGAHDRPMTPARNMEFVFKVCEALMQSENINKTLEMILNYIFQLLERVDRGVIILVDIETGKIADIICSYEKNRDETVMMYSRSIVDRVLESKKPIFMSDTLSEDKAERSESMEMMKIRSVMCVPLISRAQIRGVIYVDSVNQPFGFRKEDLKLLTALSSPAAIAVENALLHSTLELMKGE
ncbi:MAG: FHA domain-containing protein [Deltaproteobacteria bacterium]|nr:FHA domain-containing protein [Deltaproteobacteria bacterium]MBW1941660.1 FHA domain-containing protein [Deltaproteobacteria bacterium]MBW2206308.1 FHA domain-containing protein [Deltaproteobacteria bacterium]